MAKALQPYVSLTIEGNEVNFDSSKIFLIDSIMAMSDNRYLNAFHYIKLHDFCNRKC